MYLFSLISFLWLVVSLMGVIDCCRSNNRNKAAWVALIVILPILGSMLYFGFARGRLVSEI